MTDRELLRLVQDALSHLHDLPYQRHHPLGAHLNPDQPIAPPELRRRLWQAIQ